MGIGQSAEKDSNSDWLVWPGTIRLVSVAAAWFLALLVLLMSMELTPHLPIWSSLEHMATPLRVVLGVICAAGVLFGQFLFIAMLWYWVKFDYAPKSRKRLWLFSFFVGFIGIPIYALLVYRKQVLAISSLV
jgi:hypothetical protein